MRWSPVASLGIALSVCSCGSSGSADGNAVVQSVDGRSAVDTLIALIAVRVQSDDPALAGKYVDYRQVHSARLSVDNRAWGLFEIPDEPAGAAGAGLALQESDTPALVLAELGHDVETTDVPLSTIAAWVSLLDRHLAPGGHVAVLEQVTIQPVGELAIVVSPRLLAPFEIAQGDATAYLGQLVVDIDVAGGAP